MKFLFSISGTYYVNFINKIGCPYVCECYEVAEFISDIKHTD